MIKHCAIVFLLPIAILTSCSTGNTAQHIETMNAKTPVTKAQKLIGSGLLEMTTDRPIPLFRNAADSIPFDTLKFEIDKSGRTKFISRTAIAPYRLSEGDSYSEGNRNIASGLIRFSPGLKFRVINTSNNIFEIVLNEQKMETCFINLKHFFDMNKIDENDSTTYKYEPWVNYLKRAEYITKKNLIIYDRPEGHIIYEEKNDRFLPFVVTEVSGDWIRLKKAFGREFNFDDLINYDGWTQWKSSDSILIRITEHTFE